MAGADQASERLGRALPIAPGSLDLGPSTAAPVGVADSWSHIAEGSQTERRCCWEWATPSTLVATAPASVSFDALARMAEAMAREGGAACPAPIHPAADDDDGLLFAHYRTWFGCAAELEAGRLHAIAFFNPATAVRAAVDVLPATLGYAYDDASHTLSVSLGDMHATIDAEVVSFASLMRGLSPEEGLARALTETRHRLDRLVALRDATHAVVPVHDVAFVGATPMWRTTHGDIVDPPGERYITRAEPQLDRSAALARALSPGMSTPCTCDEQRAVQASLRPRTDVYSFSSEATAAELLFHPIGRGHGRVYEITCAHASRRPTADEWRAMGWTAERCEQEWKTSVFERAELMFAATSGWLTRAVLLWGRNLGAVGSEPDLASALARRCRFEPTTTITVYVPTANLVFVTDEVVDDERALRAALDQGPLLTVVLEGYALPSGADVDYCTTLRVLDQPAAPVRMQRLDFHPPRAGGTR